MTRPARATRGAASTAAALALLTTIAFARPITVSLADTDVQERISDGLAAGVLPLFSSPLPHHAHAADVEVESAVASSTSAQPEPSIVISSAPSRAQPLSASVWAPPPDFQDMSSFGVKKFAYGKQNLALVLGELPILGPLVPQVGAPVNDSAVPSTVDPGASDADPSAADGDGEDEDAAVPSAVDSGASDVDPSAADDNGVGDDAAVPSTVDSGAPDIDPSAADDNGEDEDDAPAQDNLPAAEPAAPSTSNASSVPSWTSPNGTMFQLRYPQGSINPGNEPQGGADFYAVPPPLESALPLARNLTLAYSVYFPADFDWVRGGKLPGLYGGHEGCSGGDDAESCFSTRMMWRAEGKGELYLYAPRDKQADGVCSTPPESVCDSVYGMSIARGSFSYALGGWTRISQTVVLNTPGNADGSIDVDVNGQRVMSVNGVYYRNEPGPSPAPAPSRAKRQDAANSTLADAATANATSITAAAAATPTPKRWRPPIVVFDDPSRNQAVGFTGLFFSTFFGGHEQEYATPKDQYTYFGEFEMTVNA